MEGKPILIIEDDLWICDSLRILLRSWDWLPTFAQTMRDGLEQVEQSMFQHLILDLMLPDGDGQEVLEKIRRDRRQMRVVVTSAIANQRHERLRILGAHAILNKPYTPEMLHEALTR